jgi:CTP-dependent riboflavin kinase
LADVSIRTGPALPDRGSKRAAASVPFLGTANVQVSKRRTRVNRGHVKLCLFVFTETVRNERAYGSDRLRGLRTRGCNGDGRSWPGAEG